MNNPVVTPWRRGWQRLCQQPMVMSGVMCLVLICLVCALAPLFAPFSPSAIHEEAYLASPSFVYWFGTDELGRDLLSRVLWGGRTTLGVAFVSVGLALISGAIIGVVAGYGGGWVDGALMRLIDVLLSFPPLLLILGITASLGSGIVTLIIALSIVMLPDYARLVRSLVLTTRHRDYLVAAQMVGVPRHRLLIRHILPNIISLLVVYSSVGLGNALMVTTGISFLGLGAQPPAPEWGTLISGGLPFLRQAWWMTTFPGVIIFVTAFAINLVGNGVRTTLEQK